VQVGVDVVGVDVVVGVDATGRGGETLRQADTTTSATSKIGEVGRTLSMRGHYLSPEWVRAWTRQV
jgi:hypothetical protein